MVDWSSNMLSQPARVVDPGTGSGRFLRAAARKFPKATLVGFEVNPICRVNGIANLAVIGVSQAQIYVEDYRNCNLQRISGKTLFLANPPYVRHSLIDQKWKTWLATQAGTCLDTELVVLRVCTFTFFSRRHEWRRPEMLEYLSLRLSG